MSVVRQLGSLGLEVSDLTRWREFAETVLGMEVRPPIDGEPLFLRMDEREVRLFLHEGESDDLISLGFDVDDEAALDDLCEQLERIGRPADRSSGPARTMRSAAASRDLRGAPTPTVHPSSSRTARGCGSKSPSARPSHSRPS